MNTVVYFMRHSEPFKEHRGLKNAKESILIENEKSPLSIKGEKLAEAWADNHEFDNLDSVWSSNYVRAMSTAKYFAYKNNLKVNIDERLNERIHGVLSWDELPNDFEFRQFVDPNYKIGDGENRREVSDRYYSLLVECLNQFRGKKVLIVSHASAIFFLLMRLCDIKSLNECLFKDKVFFDGNWSYLETFKLEFDSNNELVSIINIR